MLGIENYGSDDDSDTGNNSPAPTNSKAPGNPRPKKAPKKIAIGLPAFKDTPPDDDEDEDRPAKKKARLKLGSGRSALLSMLPAPKQKTAVVTAPTERVLGGGHGPGLVFDAPRPPVPHYEAEVTTQSAGEFNSQPLEEVQATSTTLFRPVSTVKRRPNISLEEKAPPKPILPTSRTDFFSLGSTASSSSFQSANTILSLPKLSSAPTIEEYVPPEPKIDDPNPGYYQLPSGQWAAHDRAYYMKFYDKWNADYNSYIRALEKGTAKGFEGANDEDTQEVNAAKEMERAKREIHDREEKKALTLGAGGAPAAPRMNINPEKLSGMARSRHQLSTLLTEAYQNREALEEKIAQGKRNRKEAGNKYGF